jgi:hypothetical protein
MNKAYSIMLFAVIVFLVTNIDGYTQNDNLRRSIKVDLLADQNQPFMRQGAELSKILVDAVRSGRIVAYSFNDFNNSPTRLATDAFQKNLALPLYFEDWDPDINYLESDYVLDNDKAYVAKGAESNIGQQPSISPNFWNLAPESYFLPYEISHLELDEQLVDGSWQLQFLHLYVRADYTEIGLAKYIGSFKANEAIAVLNESGFVWFNQYNGNILAPMGHIIGGVYLSNYDDSALESLVQNAYPLNNQVKAAMASSTYPGEKVSLLHRYGDSGIDSVYMTLVETNEIIDSMAFEHNNGRETEFHRLGDAVLMNLLEGDEQDRSLVAFQEVNKVKSKGRLKRKLETTIRERTDFEVAGNSLKSELLALMIKDIIEASNAGFIPLYEPRSLYDKEVEQVVEPFVADYIELYVEDPEQYDSNLSYSQYETVSFDGLAYVSQKNNNKGNSPSFNPQVWQPMEPAKAYYSPDVITMLDIDYRLIFKNNGKIKRKEPQTIALIIPGKYTYDGINLNLGTIDFKLLEDYAKKNKKPWLAFLKLLRDQKSLRFQMLDYTPIKEYKR